MCGNGLRSGICIEDLQDSPGLFKTLLIKSEVSYGRCEVSRWEGGLCASVSVAVPIYRGRSQVLHI